MDFSPLGFAGVDGGLVGALEPRSWWFGGRALEPRSRWFGGRVVQRRLERLEGLLAGILVPLAVVCCSFCWCWWGGVGL